MLGFEFDNNTDTFSVAVFTQALSTIVFKLIEALIEANSLFMAYTVVIGIVGILCCSCTYFFDFKDFTQK